MSEKRSRLARLGSWLRGRARRPLLDIDIEQAVVIQDRLDDELWLDVLITDITEGRRVWVVGEREFWEHVEALWRQGHERLATEWLEKFIAAPATPDAVLEDLRVRLIEMCDKRGDLATAVPHLQVLSGIEARAVRAHYLLAEHYRRRGDEALALRHYEAVLARDMDYPNVRGRVERLRQKRGSAVPASMGATIVGAEASGAQSGARYRLVRELGRGATGVVYLARDAELERDVAIKLLHPHLSALGSERACALFFEEARISASLRHPNIVAVLDLDERARRIVMELAAGGTLRQVLRERGPRTVRRALERHAQILSALTAAHRHGIVHRDLKPGNLMFRRDPDEPGAEVALGDFGVAHLPDFQDHERVGAAGQTPGQTAGQTPGQRPGQRPGPTPGPTPGDTSAEAVGTLAYMAPEQRRGAAADPRSDLYAAAVVLFEMLTGEPPWPRDVLLSGVRTADDFRLPERITTTTPARLIARLTEHLARLGDPLLENRPDTGTAAAEARDLRDQAIALTGRQSPRS